MRKGNEEKFVFICQSEGFPLAEVFWQNEKNISLTGSANTTYMLTADGLYNVTSILMFKPNTSENYSCIFWNKELNEETSAHFSTLGSYHLELVWEREGVLKMIMCFAIYTVTYYPSPEFDSSKQCNTDALEKKQVSVIYVFET